MRKALVIGIDHYRFPDAQALRGCVQDARAMESCLQTNEDNTVNFDVKLLTSSDQQGVNFAMLERTIEDFFNGPEADVAVLYFAGHGVVDTDGRVGYISSSDRQRAVRMSDIVSRANDAKRNGIGSRIIILDCCHSGMAGEAEGGGSALGVGTTILTSSDRDQPSEEGAHHGLFTEYLLDGLGGGCSDILGNITAGSLYAFIDQTLGAFEQRPIFKANVNQFVIFRKMKPKIALDRLRKVAEYFPKADHVFRLDPSYEPDRKSVSKKLRALSVDEEHVLIFKDLQRFNRYGLVLPTPQEDMFFAAMESGGCQLTALGRHYRRLAMKRRF